MHRPAPTAPCDPPAPLRVGIALGGGSARGYAHIGVLAALERRGLAPDVIVGTSFGALVGALYAAGRTPGELRADAERLRRRDVLPRIVDVGLRHGALFSGRRLESYIRGMVGDARIEDLPRTFAVVATDVDTGERVVLRTGPLALALRASASLPGLFAPVAWEGRRLIDGGIATPVPLDTLDGFGVDVALGVGAGIEVRDSRGLRAARAAVQTPAGRWVCRALAAPACGSSVGGATVDQAGVLTTLGRALALTLGAWGSAVDSLPDAGGDGALHVQTRPPIHWLRFDRAAVAIQAGESAMDLAWPGLGRRLGHVAAS